MRSVADKYRPPLSECGRQRNRMSGSEQGARFSRWSIYLLLGRVIVGFFFPGLLLSVMAQEPTIWPWPLEGTSEPEPQTFRYETYETTGEVLLQVLVTMAPRLSIEERDNKRFLRISLGEERVTPEEQYRRRDPVGLDFDYEATLWYLRPEYAYQEVEAIIARFSTVDGALVERQSGSVGLMEIPEGATLLESFKVLYYPGNGRHEQEVTFTFGPLAPSPTSVPLAAVVGVGLLAILLSFGLDLAPGVGTVKGMVEAFTGRDVITGEELAWWERALGIVPFLGSAGDVARGLGRVGDLADTAGDITRAGRAADIAGTARTADRGRDATRAANQMGDLGDAARLADTPAPGVARVADDLDVRHIDAPPLKCFVAGTLVQIPDQPPQLIETIRPGDLVLSAEGASRRAIFSRTARRRVERVFHHSANRVLQVRFKADEPVFISVTPGHFFATPGGYRKAGFLSPGDEVLCASGESATIESIEEKDEAVEVFNLEIEADHCYFVSPLALLVHNPAGDCTEFRSQLALEDLLEQEGFGFLRRDGSFGSRNSAYVREPVFQNGSFMDEFTTRRPRGEPRRGTMPHYRGTVKADTTRPDIYGREGNVKISYELKTPRRGSSVEAHFLDEQGNLTRHGEDVLNQITGRNRHMPADVEQRFIIDLRQTGQSVEDAMGDFQKLAKRGDLQNLFGHYSGGARFITEDVNGVTRLSELQKWEKWGIQSQLNPS